jgi:hypothetical protein
MVIGHPLRPARKRRAHAGEDRLACDELDAVTLPVVKADGFDPRVALERPRKAGGRILSSREEDERGAGQI